MYRWKVKNYGVRQDQYPALAKRMDILKMKGKHKRISVHSCVYLMLGYKKYLIYLENGSI